MSDIRIQFHALPSETISLIKEVVLNLNVHAIIIKSFPFIAKEATVDELDVLLDESPRNVTIALTVDSPLLQSPTKMAFIDNNPDCLIFEIEFVTKEGLKQSSMTARSNNPEIVGKWNMISRLLELRSDSGVTATSVANGVSSVYKRFRYTKGAYELALGGVPMLPVAGNSRIQFRTDIV